MNCGVVFANNHTKDNVMTLPKKKWDKYDNLKQYKHKQDRDLMFGAEGEAETLPVLIEYFGFNIKKLHRFSCFDFCSDDKKTYFELKTRRNDKNKYPSTIVPTSKLVKAKKLFKKGCDVYFVFNFEDVISIIKYDKDPKKFKHKIATGGRWDRNKDETKSYAYIYCANLTDITECETAKMMFIDDSEDSCI